MQITVLVDNNTLIDNYYIGEPALCYHIIDGEISILFDVGYSDAFIKNACSLGIDLTTVSAIAISHGHNDHTGGLQYWEKAGLPACRLIAHPHAFLHKTENGISIGCPCESTELQRMFSFEFHTGPAWISEHLVFLGEIPTVYDFEARRSFGTTIRNGVEHDDFLLDDTALVYRGDSGLFIITGCSHSGICNIIDYAKKVCGDTRVAGVIGGFHLFNTSSRLSQTIEYFTHNTVGQLYPCHCVSFAAKAEIHKYILVHEVGVGMQLHID